MSRVWSRRLRPWGLAAALALAPLLGQAQVDSTDGGSLTIHVNGSEKMRVDSSGRVGIGTASPLATLQVSGSIVASGSAGPFFSASDNANNGQLSVSATGANTQNLTITPRLVNATYFPAPMGSAGVGLVANTHLGIVGSYIHLMTTTGAGPGLFLQNSTHRVGIGTTYPSATLHVIGTISATDAIQPAASSLACGSAINGPSATTAPATPSKSVSAASGPASPRTRRRRARAPCRGSRTCSSPTSPVATTSATTRAPASG